MHIQVVTVTPEMATEWLKRRNDKNRRVSLTTIKKIADCIIKGEWSLNGETICFGEDGRLLDGQHRLHAIIMAGQSVRTTIVTGVTDERAFETYDSVQRLRSADQIAAMKGVENSARVTAAARIVWHWERSKTVREFGMRVSGGAVDATPHEMSEKAVEIEPEAVAAYEMIGGSITKAVKMGSALIATIIILNRIDPVSTQDFFRKVRTGVVDDEHDPALIYRDRLIGGYNTAKREYRWKMTMIVMTIKAWNAHKTGKVIRHLTFRQDGPKAESFPAPIGGGKY